jgi:hypothetical protein
MLSKIMETLSWGTTCAFSSTIMCIMLGVKRKDLRNIILMSTVLGMIRGYTGKNIIALCFYD